MSDNKCVDIFIEKSQINQRFLRFWKKKYMKVFVEGCYMWTVIIGNRLVELEI